MTCSRCAGSGIERADDGSNGARAYPDCASGRVQTPMPWYEQLIGGWTGDVLAWLGKRAKKRGDDHEFWHIYAAIVLGNTNHDERWPCHLAAVLPYLPIQPKVKP